MLPLLRQQKILDLLKQHGVVSVGRLARSVRASEMTVRRDLVVLGDRGLVRRLHGGAVLERGKAEESPFSNARHEHVEEKEAIAKEAAALVSPGSVVALGAGTTTWHVARVLAARTDLTFITNSTNIALELDRGQSNIILTGGHFRTPADAPVGPPSLWTLERLQRAGSRKKDRRLSENSALLDGRIPRPSRRADNETTPTESRSPLQGQGGARGLAR